MVPEFTPWPKIARLNRDIVITEKIDGTNAAIGVLGAEEQADLGIWTPGVDEEPAPLVYAQSRTRIITPEQDNFGFARWVADHADLLGPLLGPGVHFGEWWGSGIQRGYGQSTKRFSLFNTARWSDLGTESWIGVVPVLYEGLWSQYAVEATLELLREEGSMAAPGFAAEGIVIYHTAAKTMFKITLEGDARSKGEELAALQEASKHK